jgi:putative peptidoglycan lipid II flippase
MFVLPHSIITVSVVTALMPRMSHLAHEADWRGLRRDLSRAMRMCAAALVPASIVLFLLGPRLAQLLLGYGNAGDAGARAVGQVLQVFTVGLVGYSVYYVLLRGFFALEDTRTPALLNFFLNAVNLAVGYSLYRALPLGHQVDGLALGYAAGYVATTVVFWLILRHRLGGLDTYVTVRTFVRLALAGAVAFAVGMLLFRLLDPHVGAGKVGALVDCVVVGPAVLLVFAGVARAIRVAEVRQVVDLVAARLRR